MKIFSISIGKISVLFLMVLFDNNVVCQNINLDSARTKIMNQIEVDKALYRDSNKVVTELSVTSNSNSLLNMTSSEFCYMKGFCLRFYSLCNSNDPLEAFLKIYINSNDYRNFFKRKEVDYSLLNITKISSSNDNITIYEYKIPEQSVFKVELGFRKFLENSSAITIITVHPII